MRETRACGAEDDSSDDDRVMTAYLAASTVVHNNPLHGIHGICMLVFGWGCMHMQVGAMQEREIASACARLSVPFGGGATERNEVRSVAAPERNERYSGEWFDCASEIIISHTDTP